MQITQTLLTEVSFQVSDGNPLWGLALANEYLSPSEPLHIALVQRVRSRLHPRDFQQPLAKRLCAGERAKDLPQALQLLVGSRVMQRSPSEYGSPRCRRLGAPHLRAPRRPASIRRRSVMSSKLVKGVQSQDYSSLRSPVVKARSAHLTLQRCSKLPQFLNTVTQEAL